MKLKNLSINIKIEYKTKYKILKFLFNFNKYRIKCL